VGIVEQLHFQATLPGVWQRLRDAIEHTTIATAGDTPLQGELEVPVLLARDEVNGPCFHHRAEHAPLTHQTALRKDVLLIASPALAWQGVEGAHTLLLGPLPCAPEGMRARAC
jgi:hypothetical protein